MKIGLGHNLEDDSVWGPGGRRWERTRRRLTGRQTMTGQEPPIPEVGASAQFLRRRAADVPNSLTRAISRIAIVSDGSGAHTVPTQVCSWYLCTQTTWPHTHTHTDLLWEEDEEPPRHVRRKGSSANLSSAPRRLPIPGFLLVSYLLRADESKSNLGQL